MPEKELICEYALESDNSSWINKEGFFTNSKGEIVCLDWDAIVNGHPECERCVKLDEEREQARLEEEQNNVN